MILFTKEQEVRYEFYYEGGIKEDGAQVGAPMHRHDLNPFF